MRTIKKIYAIRGLIKMAMSGLSDDNRITKILAEVDQLLYEVGREIERQLIE